MNRLSPVLPIVLLFATTAGALDLTQVPRTIAKEPTYQSRPKYCLLVFGPQAKNRVWLVHDGDTLYADLNGDGDLTDPAERIAPHESSSAEDNMYAFEVGEIREGDLLHKSLAIGTTNLQHLAQSEPLVRAALSKDPQSRFYGIKIELELPGRRGVGIGGRVEHLVSPLDVNGLLEFAETAESAPIIHFGGDWEITLFGPTQLTVGRQKEVFLGLGTPGLGSGTTAFAAYQDLVPDGLFPKLEFALPGDTGKKAEYLLHERCCTINFHGGIRLPDDAASGDAVVTITFDDWIGGFVAPTTHRIPVVKPKFDVVLKPVSPRLKASLIHPTRDGVLYEIRFSADGKRIIAGDYPGGIVQLWDVESGELLTTIETGYGRHSRTTYFHLDEDWQSVYASRADRKLVRVERDGKKLNRWECNGDVRIWDLETGQLQRKLQHAPPRSIRRMDLSPNGRYFLTGDEIPGEYEGRPPRALSLWDTKTGEYRDLSGSRAYGVFSPDSSRVAVDQLTDEWYSTEVRIYESATCRLSLSIPIKDDFVQLFLLDFTPEGTVLVGHVDMTSDINGPIARRSSLRFWDTDSGDLISTINAEEGERFQSRGTFSPDGRNFALPNFRSEPARLYVVDIVRGEVIQTIDFGMRDFVRAPAFSPDGRWMAVITQVFPENPREERTSEVLPQPRIHLVKSATSEVVETIIAPQGIPTSLAFSPDGRTLASGGHGRVLLWDLSTPPGELATR